jgi:esterase|eukprot:TRINITY_DN43711_c0_g1_i1.p1 TRINITY_DN43711_c0_g1~~TRINITY_DN43711_c0_g1_i1.p1  ORF type:complete len:344 (-),score=44.72 TRINITY_DN43711_c0_g1_i1:168-1199(-)
MIIKMKFPLRAMCLGQNAVERFLTVQKAFPLKLGTLPMNSPSVSKTVPLHVEQLKVSCPTEPSPVSAAIGKPHALCIHGILGSCRNLKPFGSALQRRNGYSGQVSLVDLRNHGQSGHADTMGFPEMAADIVESMDVNGIDRACLVGHSLGGKVAAAVALLYPHRVDSLVLLDIAPVAYGGASSATRVWGDLSSQLVELLERIPLNTLGNRRAVETRLDEASASHAYPPWFKTFALTNLVRDATTGRMSWRANIPAIKNSGAVLRGFDLGSQGPNFRFTGPTLFVRGGRSQYVPNEQSEEVASRFPRHTVATIEQAGHFLHAEHAKEVVDIIHDFLGSKQLADE